MAHPAYTFGAHRLKRCLKMKKIKQCLDCNKYFTWTDSKQKRCKECQKVYRSRGRYHDSEWKKYTRVCICCGLNFKSKNGRAKRCDECIPKIECNICGKIMSLTRKNQMKKYCSKECSARAKIDHYYNGTYTETLNRDNFRCQKCGTYEDLCVHHIDYSGGANIKTCKANNNLDNLITLCNPCHHVLHNKINKAIVAKYISEVKSITEKFIRRG